MDKKRDKANANQVDQVSEKDPNLDSKKSLNESVIEGKNEIEDKQFNNKKRPIFERKIKVSGNDSFLKQIFS